MTGEKTSFARSQTVECPDCSGAGEIYEVEPPEDGATFWDSGVSLFEAVEDGAVMTGEIRECSRCNGFGRLNAAEVR